MFAALLSKFIAITFKAFQHVVAINETRLCGGTGGLMPAPAAAAHEHHQRFRIDLLLEMGQKKRIGSLARIGLPFELDAARNATGQVPFGM